LTKEAHLYDIMPQYYTIHSASAFLESCSKQICRDLV